jgi:uncharacterized phage protein gp47/JayE
MARSFTEIIESMHNYITSLYPNLDISEGTIVEDVVVKCTSQEFSKLYDEMLQVSKEQSILTASESGLNALGNNFSIQRKNERHSRGKIIFFRFNVPTQDITIPVGTIVSVDPTGEDDVQFITTTPVTMFLSLASMYLNTTTGLYEVTTDIEAIEGGKKGIVGSNVITSIVTLISGINGCYNPFATIGGADIESKESLRNRIAIKTRGNTIGTTDGILSEILQYPDVEDAIIEGNGTSERSDFGAIDIFVRGRIDQSYTDFYVVKGTLNESITLSKQPVISDGIVSIVSSASGAIPSSAYSLNKDTLSFRGSINAYDNISFSPPLDTSYGALLITYSYNSLISSLQNIFNASNKQIQNTNILIMWASELPINIESSIKILTGFDYTTVVTNIEENLSVFFTNTTIGEQIQQADVAKIILDTPGVDDLLLPFTVFQSSDGVITRDTFGNLNIPARSYSILGSVTLTQVV